VLGCDGDHNNTVPAVRAVQGAEYLVEAERRRSIDSQIDGLDELLDAAQPQRRHPRLHAAYRNGLEIHSESRRAESDAAICQTRPFHRHTLRTIHAGRHNALQYGQGDKSHNYSDR